MGAGVLPPSPRHPPRAGLPIPGVAAAGLAIALGIAAIARWIRALSESGGEGGSTGPDGFDWQGHDSGEGGRP